MLRKLEKYEVLEELGHGGMATVYRARDTVLDRPVALKVMHPHLRGAEEARRRFHREAQSVARMRHPRVLEIYDFSGEGSAEAYIAAELLTGPTLKIWREQCQDVPAEVAACFAIEIAKALEHAHGVGIVHRDVKPENVLLHESRTLKLTDFGIADMIDAQSMTATGQILGSPGHMSPEQIEGKDCDPRTDLFSLGTVLYYLATGRLPFTGRNPHQVLKRIVDGEYADPLRVNPTIGGRLRSIIVKALEHDPADRFQSAREMITDLEAFIAEAGIVDATQMLERYLGDPARVCEEVRVETIARMIDHGSRASDAGDVPGALDYYNRVLALDEGNERVLKLIARVGMDRRRRAILGSAAGLGALGVLSAVVAWGLWPEAPREDDVQVRIDTAAHTDGGSDGGEDAGASPRDAGERRLDAGVADGGQRARERAAEAGIDAGRPARRGNGAGEVRASAPRLVVFDPSPFNVAIGVDGAGPLTPVQRRSMELRPGPHVFLVVPGEEIRHLYNSRTFRETIEAGEDEQRLALQLPFAAAPLSVRCSAPAAAVSVAGRVSGRANDAILVPMRLSQESLVVTVTAPGFATHEERVLFGAGRSEEIHVTLRPLGPGPAP